MSIVLVGSTSGSCTLQEQAVAGTTVLTLPTTSGTILTTASSGQSIPKAALPAGSVLQVVNANYAISTFSSSITYADTGLSATITPTSATSKILVCVQQNGIGKVTSANAYVGVQLQRNSTPLALIVNTAGYNNTTSPNYVGGISLEYLDSPATTSAVTYKTQFRSTGNVATAYVQIDNEMSTITLMEIAA